MANQASETRKSKEKVLLAIVDFKKTNSFESPNDILSEMQELVLACGSEVTGHIMCPIAKPTASVLIGEGKVQEIADLCAMKNIDIVIFSYDLKGSQQRNLEEAIKVRIIDRTQLILDIFARRAISNEGKMQVELAQLVYLLPRLVGHGTELSRLGGGIGTLGPGETKLEVDRRRIAERITRLQRELKEVGSDRDLKRKKRKDKGIPAISLIGYTNAGKSTLFNALTNSSQVVQNAMFTTLDSLARQLVLPNHQKVVISDTVGFMHDLPHNLIEAFKATLEDVREADLLLHVLDVSHPNFRRLYDSVNQVLEELDANHKPIIMVLNKIDKIKDQHWLKSFQDNFEHAVCISAKTGQNVPLLLEKIGQLLAHFFIEVNVDIPINRMDLVNLAHQEGEVYSVKYYNDHINIRASIPSKLAGKFQITS